MEIKILAELPVEGKKSTFVTYKAGEPVAKYLIKAGHQITLSVDGVTLTGHQTVAEKHVRLVKQGDHLLLETLDGSEKLVELTNFYAENDVVLTGDQWVMADGSQLQTTVNGVTLSLDSVVILPPTSAGLVSVGFMVPSLAAGAGLVALGGGLSPARQNEPSPPAVSHVAITNATGAKSNLLNVGDVVTTSVTFSEAVFVTGTPQIGLTVNGVLAKLANYVGGSGTNTLTFSYTIVSGDNDGNGISISANAITLSGGSIKNASSTDATLTHAGVADNAGYLVDTMPPDTPSAAPSSYVDNTGRVQSPTSTATITDDTNPGLNIGGLSYGMTAHLFVDNLQVQATYDPVSGALTPNLPISPGTHQLSYSLIDLAGNESGRSPAITLSFNPFSQGDAVLETRLGWRLTAPIQIEDPNSPDYGKWYYYLDKDASNSASMGDRLTYAELADVFNKDVNGSANPAGQHITDVYRYATIDGIQLALPTIGHGLTVPGSTTTIEDGWGVMDGLSYGDLSEIYDQFNTAGANQTEGIPPDWASGDASDMRMSGQDAETWYWAATDGGLQGQQSGISWRGITTMAASEASGLYHVALQMITTDIRTPTLLSSYPVDESTTIYGTENIKLHFSEVVQAGSGSMLLSNGTDSRLIDINDAAQVRIAGKTLSLNPTLDLQPNTTYHLTMGAGVVSDLAGNAYAGLLTGQLDFGVSGFVRKFKFSDIGTAAADFGYKVIGAGIGDVSRASIDTPLDDINGDGINDLLIGAPDSARTSTSYPSLEPHEAGHAYVVYGRTSPANLRLENLSSTEGYRVAGEYVQPAQIFPVKDGFGNGVVSVGDLNADGYVDWFATATSNRQNNDTSQPEQGAAYLVYGSAAQTNLDLSSGLGAVAKLKATNAYGGTSLLNMTSTDWDRDGVQDLVFSTQELNGSNQTVARTYFLNGTAITTNAEYDDLAAFEVNVPSYYSGGSVFRAKAGDINGDGLEDYLFAQHVGGEKVYVVYGKNRIANLDVSSMTVTDGYAVNLPNTSAQYTRGIGDINGDGFDDLLIGSNVENSTNISFPDSYVMFGGQAGLPLNVDLNNVGTSVQGFKIRSNTGTPYRIMENAATVGDLNGDGVSDFILQYRSSYLDFKTYVVHGGQQWENGGTLNIDDIGVSISGFEIDHIGSDSNGNFMKFYNSGDLNGDGVQDLVFSSPAKGAGEDTYAGETTVVLGGKHFSNVMTQWGTGGADALSGTSASESMVGGLDNDMLFGNGGNDVMYGGQGNDTFVLNQSNIDAFSQGIANGRMARMDGGTGVDTLRLFDGADIDLRNIDFGRIESLERIDASSDSGASTIDLSRESVIPMTTRGTGVAGSGHQLAIVAGTGDSVNLHGSWTSQADHTIGSDTYKVWRATGTEFDVWVNGGAVQVVI